VPRAFFFQEFPASTVSSHTAAGKTTLLSQFPLAQRDSVAMHPSDPRQLLDAAATDLRCEQPSQQPSHPFVCHRKQTIDRPVFLRNRRTRMLSANYTIAAMDRTNLICNHMNSPP
jgi:hypothetical protein